ncbi:MAG: hypothetical protein ACJ71Y_11855 [Blastococcus sp.]|jgi:hypothetical protein
MTHTPLAGQQLDEIEAKAAELRERLDRKNPWPSDNESHWTAEGWKAGTRNALDKLHVEALVAEVRRLRALLPDLATRWEQMADHGDTAIGHFEGPAAATLVAEVGERGRTYRKAAADVLEVLRTGRIPHDLMTDAELKGPDAARPAAAVAAVAETGQAPA